MTEKIIVMALEILGALLIIGLGFLGRYLKQLLTEKIGAAKFAELEGYVAILTAAADQTLKAEDPTGTKRYDYVIGRLAQLGYEITDYVKDVIEAKVLKLP